MLQCCLEMVDFMLARNTCHRQLPEQYTSYFLLAKHLVTFILVTIIALLWFARFKSTGKMLIKFIAVHYDDYIQGSSDGVLYCCLTFLPGVCIPVHCAGCVWWNIWRWLHQFAICMAYSAHCVHMHCESAHQHFYHRTAYDQHSLYFSR